MKLKSGSTVPTTTLDLTSSTFDPNSFVIATYIPVVYCAWKRVSTKVRKERSRERRKELRKEGVKARKHRRASVADSKKEFGE